MEIHVFKEINTVAFHTFPRVGGLSLSTLWQADVLGAAGCVGLTAVAAGALQRVPAGPLDVQMKTPGQHPGQLLVGLPFALSAHTPVTLTAIDILTTQRPAPLWPLGTSDWRFPLCSSEAPPLLWWCQYRGGCWDLQFYPCCVSECWPLAGHMGPVWPSPTRRHHPEAKKVNI